MPLAPFWFLSGNDGKNIPIFLPRLREKEKSKWKHYIAKNQEVINGWCVDGWEWSVPVTHEEYEKAKTGKYQIYLTPAKSIPAEWLQNIKGKRVFALASGGGQQGPVLTALGAGVTVMGT